MATTVPLQINGVKVRGAGRGGARLNVNVHVHVISFEVERQ